MTPDVAKPELVGEARRIAQSLAGRGDEIDALRRVPDDVWRELVDSGVARAYQPRRWGGGEVDPWTFSQSVMEVAKVNGSVAWVLGVLGVHPWQTATYSPRAQDEIWGKDPTVFNSSSYSPTGKVERVDGGFRLNGTWSFSTGSDLCTWVNVGGIPGKRALPSGADVPDYRSFLLPISDYTIVHNWDVAGLSGTGSNDIRIDGAFVPEHRSISHWDYALNLPVPGWEYNDGPLYRIPWGLIFNFALAASLIGAAQGFLDAWIAITKTRLGANNVSVRDDAAIQTLAAEATYVLDVGALALERDCNELMSAAQSKAPLPLGRRARMRFAASHSAQDAARVVDRLYEKSSGRIVFRDHPLQRRYQDIKAMVGHVYLNDHEKGRATGSALLGSEPLDFGL